VVGLRVCLGAGVVKVAKDEEQRWTDHVLPLPKEISIPKKAMLRPGDVRIVLSEGAGVAAQNAAAEVRQFFKDEAGAVPNGDGFEIVIGALGPNGAVAGTAVKGVERLREFPNRDQAYIIQPVGERKLVLTGLSDKGVYYAQVALRQLLGPVTNKEEIQMPLVSVVDWPDVEERGLWNCGLLVIDLAPSAKLNYMKGNVYLGPVKKGKPNHAWIRKGRRERALRVAVNHVPAITHLNFLRRCGIYQTYPELLGKGDGAIAGQYHAHRQEGVTVENRVPCSSNPLLSEILAEWLMSVAESGVPECGCWLSERPAQCECENCRDPGQFVLEARAFVNAWRKVRAKHPDFVIRLFISTTTDERYGEVLAELPERVKLGRACATSLERKRHEPRDLFVNERIDPRAARGLWVATYDVPVVACSKVETPELIAPCSSAHRVRDFIRQMAARKYRGMYGMMEGGILRTFSVEAFAEWTWNLNGRSEREFAVAWARRHGYEDPEAVGEWSELLGPVAWDVYDSGYPECYTQGLAAKMVRERQRPVLGEGMFRYYRNGGAFDEKIATCRKALAIAKELGKPELTTEALAIMSYVKMVRHIYLIANGLSSGDLSDKEDEKTLHKNVEELMRAADENVAAIRAWRSVLGPKPWHRRVQCAIDATVTTVREVAKAVVQLLKADRAQP